MSDGFVTNCFFHCMYMKLEQPYEKTQAAVVASGSRGVPLQNLRAEITSLRRYRVKYANARKEVASLQAQLDEASDVIADMNHAVAEAKQMDPPQPNLRGTLRLHIHS